MGQIMFHEVKLIFGYDGYCGDVAVTPKSMMEFLTKPFERWLYKKTWDATKIDNWTESNFHIHVFESTSHYNDEDFFFDPRSAEWLGFRVSLEQTDAEVEFVFTSEHIGGEIRPDIDKLSTSLCGELKSAKSILNRALEGIMRRDLKSVNRS